MRIVFRVDASVTIGAGHVMRCLTLAEALRERGAQPLFVCRPHEGNLCELIATRGFDLSVLSPPRFDLPGYGAWLGADWQSDAEETRCVLLGLESPPEWLVADHYAIDARWETTLRPHAGKLMAIDDLADRPHDCDLLLDQNLVADMDTRYAGLLPSCCETLLGPAYALLQPEFAQARRQAKVRTGRIRRVLVFFGGGDKAGMTAITIAALNTVDFPGLEVDVVVGASNPDIENIRAQIALYPNIRPHLNLPTLAPLIAAADLGVGACGGNVWERLCLGLPSIVITLAENQRAAAVALHRKGLVRWIGDHENVGIADLVSALRKAFSEDLAAEWSETCFGAVDGKGVERVVEAMRLAPR
ncbi:MAG: UDP-2,4-diacetamido-2,4,6-trideoxy-beta-L-altropyranose hydrolase [Burkholderiaceae bacterium]|nr:UDP-2,4-diacetamido-2,4,6-trideoxy-beta-L-altropyranose hydrolase [Burkholderiaceae bacterium]MDO9316887.1 UDP-2,4-diacetamido-2,4,6-trideoxy-beta-L-altropyranose hydrolase [Gammaproteobacteria bacterium]